MIGIALKLNVLLLCVFIFFSCAVHNSVKTTRVAEPTSTENYFLPGIDSSVAKNALQFSDRLIVDFNRRKQAGFFYEKGRNSFQSAESLWSCIDSEPIQDSNFIQIYSNWSKKHVASRDKSISVEDMKSDKLYQIYLTVLDTAQKEISQAKLFNPFDLEIRSLLIKIYLKQGEITHDKVHYTRTIDELNKFLNVDKSNPYIYEKLGESYFALNDWDNSYRFFHEAEKILKIVVKFKHQPDPKESVSFDTTRWTYYLQRQGEAKARLYDAENAILFLSQAKEFTKSDELKQELQEILDWINWDGGNIRASEIRDNIIKLENANSYKEAKAQYLKLLKILKTQKAKNEINWKISSLDYNFLDRKKEALRRLFLIIQDIRTTDQASSLHEVYLKDYAAMCYSFGMDHFNNNNYRLAYIYLNQASQIDWNHKGDCFFQLSVLSHENPTETIYLCNKALDYADQLSKTKLNSLYELLAVSYKRKGEFEIADRYFKKWVNQHNVIKN